MDQEESKKKIVIPIITFLIGAIVGSILTILLIPNDCPVCEEDNPQPIINESDQNIEDTKKVKGSTTEIVVENQPIVSETAVSLPKSNCNITVDISGAVNEPGVYCFPTGSKIVDAVKKAKGFKEGIAYKYVSMKINLSEQISDFQKIYIPFEEDVYCELKSLQYIDTPQEPTQQDNSDNSTSDSTQTCININSATLDQLTSLNGVGESTAQKIIDSRPYEKIEDILNVSGIGESTYEKFKDDICVY
jgi:competence protein ComEA